MRQKSGEAGARRALAMNKALIVTLAVLVALLVCALAETPSTALAAQKAGAGQLAVVGTDSNIRIFDAEGENPFPLVTDGRRGSRAYAWPTWSTDGRLAYFGSSLLADDGYTLRVFVQRRVTPDAEPHIAFSALGETFTYAYWAPGDCAGDDCRDLALLYTPTTGASLGMRLLRNEGDVTTEWANETGAPFYYSFSPDGSRMIWHRYETQLEYYDVEARRIEGLDDRPGVFAAPMWSPLDERVLFAVRGERAGRSDVIVAQGDQRTTLIRNMAAPVSFAFSPDGTRAAVLDGDGVLTVLDVESGETVASRSVGITLAFFWSPQSEQLIYVALPRRGGRSANLRQDGGPDAKTTAQNVPGLSVNLFNPTTQTNELLGTYIPTRDMIYYLQFYDQFSRSHSLWSPDGHYFAFGALIGDARSSVVLFDTTSPGKTKTISESTVGIWSWN